MSTKQANMTAPAAASAASVISSDKMASESSSPGYSSDTPTASSKQSPPTPERKSPSLHISIRMIGSFLIFCNAWGIILAFGAFETYYVSTLLSGYSESAISWIGTSSAFLLLLGGGPAGALYDQGYTRPMLIVGCFLITFGMFMTSLSSQYYQLFLSQGVTVGLGASMLWIPCMSVVATHFADPGRRALAVGFISSGSSIGGIIYPIIFKSLLSRVGFGWTVRVMAFVCLGTCAIALAALLPPRPNRMARTRRLIDVSALREPRFVTWMLAGFFGLAAYYPPLVFLPLFAQTQVHDLPSSDFPFYTLAIVNGASAVSRIGAGFIAARFGAIRTHFTSVAVSSVLLFGMIGLHNTAGLVVWSVLWGLFTGLLISLPGSIVVDLCPSPDVIGTRMGMTFYGSAVGILVGAPISGTLITSNAGTGTSWLHLQIFGGVVMAVAALLLVPAWMYLSRKARNG